jgi:hypothetical protein
MPRYFTLPEAERLLPEVEVLLRDALFQKAEYQRIDQDLKRTMHRIQTAGGSRLNPGHILRLRAGRDQAGVALQGIFDKVGALGVQIKDLDIGLIDFLSKYHGREVCLCWKLGEDKIRFWHGTDEGFRGRKAIDEEFLANHQGDSVV